MKTNRYSICALTLTALLQFPIIANATESKSSGAVPAETVPAVSKEEFIEGMAKKVLSTKG